MTLLERIVHFRRAACSQDDRREDEELIDAMSNFELLEAISDAFEHARASQLSRRIVFSKYWR